MSSLPTHYSISGTIVIFFFFFSLCVYFEQKLAKTHISLFFLPSNTKHNILYIFCSILLFFVLFCFVFHITGCPGNNFIAVHRSLPHCPSWLHQTPLSGYTIAYQSLVEGNYDVSAFLLSQILSQ